MKKFLFVICTVCAAAGLFAQHKITIQNGSKTTFYGYDSLAFAVQQAAAGDTLYLPCATINLTEDLTIDKQLTIIGCGWDLDSLSTLLPSVIAQYNIKFVPGSDGSTITGCDIKSVVISPTQSNHISNITIFRNRLISMFIDNEFASRYL